MNIIPAVGRNSYPTNFMEGKISNNKAIDLKASDGSFKTASVSNKIPAQQETMVPRQVLENILAWSEHYQPDAYYHIYYTEESTEENPIVLAEGVDETGNEFRFEIRINDINPENASFVEMEALMRHRKKDFTANDCVSLSVAMQLPDFGILKKSNYPEIIEQHGQLDLNAGFTDMGYSLFALAARLKNFADQKTEEAAASILDIIS